MDPHAIFVTHFEPRADGDGGNHRAYQIESDLQSILGASCVTTASWWRWNAQRSLTPSARGRTPLLSETGLAVRRRLRTVPGIRAAWTAGRRLKDRLSSLSTAHPLADLQLEVPLIEQLSASEFVEEYTRTVTSLPRPLVCLVEHPGFRAVVAANRRMGIPTISCVQNLEAFDIATPWTVARKREAARSALQFLAEFEFYAACDARLFISRVEAGLVGGLGLPSSFYPYYPAGEIRQSLLRVRSDRAATPPEKGLFLMLGTALHETTARSFRAFLTNAARDGLPPGVRLIVCGAGTEAFVPFESECIGLQVRGRVSQPELESLLRSATGVVVPQYLGFGALTRIPELTLCGIPVLTTEHVALALIAHSSVRVVPDSWAAWCTEMVREWVSPTEQEGDAERAQSVLRRAIGDLL